MSPIRTLNDPAGTAAAHWQGQGHKVGNGPSSTTTTATVNEQAFAQENMPQAGSGHRKTVVGKITAEGKRVNSVAPTGAVIDIGNVILGSAKYKPDLGGDKAEYDSGDIEVENISSNIDALSSLAPVGVRIELGNIAIEAQP